MSGKAMAMLDGSFEPGSWLKDYRVPYVANLLTMRFLLGIQMPLRLMKLFPCRGIGSDFTTLSVIAGQDLLSLAKRRRSVRTTYKLLTDTAIVRRATRFLAM